MGSDRARVSFDPSRKWRGLVAQQGRVTVEADWNEAAAIDAERDRAAILEVVGPYGSPDGGYAVTARRAGGRSFSAVGGLTIGRGTLYLGGERLDLDVAVDYDTQPDWLDQSPDSLWVAPVPPPASPPSSPPSSHGPTTELAYLVAVEQEVSAVEDPALADVALGGPDTMQRLRILQHFVRRPTQASSCDLAWKEVQKAWAEIGLNFDPATMRLESTASLQVSFAASPTEPSQCEPVATGGYLGAENQLLRVQITGVDPMTGVPTLVWGFDDATFLYPLTSATPDGNGNLVLTLARSPVDSYHYPASGQAVEVLRETASLPSSDHSTASEGFIASATGVVATLTQGYDPTSRTVVMAGPLLPDYQDAKQLYLRVWQGSAPAPAGTAVLLDGAGATTGVTVTLDSTDQHFHAGDFWRFALRPSVPDLIYPDRIGLSPQAPDGARVWACPLALVSWRGEAGGWVTPCVPPFENLVELTRSVGGCCTVNVRPQDVQDSGALQALVDSYAGKYVSATLCFEPGIYTLTQPLVLDSRHQGLTIQGCREGAVFQGAKPDAQALLLGLIVLQDVTSVTIRDIQLNIPFVDFTPDASLFAGVNPQNVDLINTYAGNLQVGIGISVNGATDLRIEGCTLTFFGEGNRNVFSAGVYATGTLEGLEVNHCTFSAPEPTTLPFADLVTDNPLPSSPPSAPPPPPALPYQLSFGYVQLPTTDPAQDASAVPVLDDARFEVCSFDGVTVPMVVLGQVGNLRLERNTLRSCYGGFWVLSFDNPSFVTFLNYVAVGDPIRVQQFETIGLGVLADRIFPLATSVARVLPLTPPIDAPVNARSIAPASAAALRTAQAMFRRILPASADAVRLFGQPGVADTPATIETFDTGTSTVLRLDVADNQVDAIIAGSDSAAGLCVVDDTPTTIAGSVMMRGNRIRDRFGTGHTTVLAGIAEATVTGNIVANELLIGMRSVGRNLHLALRSGPPTNIEPPVAVTGNVFIGSNPTLPSRSLGTPFVSWLPFNAITPYIAPVTPDATGGLPRSGRGS